MPASKITDGAIAGAIVAILIWIAKLFELPPIPAEVASAMTVLVGFVTSYFMPERAVTIDSRGTVAKK